MSEAANQVRHHLSPTIGTVTDVFDRDLPPALEVHPGDHVRVETLDAAGNLAPHRSPGVPSARLLEEPRGHCLTGPIRVHGALPGQHLAVELVRLTPGDWGWTAAGHPGHRLGTLLQLPEGETEWLLWRIDGSVARNQHGHEVDVRPFLGVIGMPPDEPGEHSTIPPRQCGGNLDCRALVEGSTLFLPVTVPGAMLCLGDGHAAQGDGEVSGSAIECPMVSEMRLTLVDDAPVPGAHAVTPEGRLTFGLAATLDEAAVQALDGMLCWIQRLLEVARPLALALASTTVDLRVTQLANETWGVHAVLPHGALRLTEARGEPG